MVQNVDEELTSSLVQTGSPSRLGKLRRILFYALAALLSAFFLLGFWDILPGVVLGWMPDSVLTSLHPDFEQLFVPHRLHQMAMHAILWSLILGVVLQLHNPEHRVAPLVQSLSVFLMFDIIELAVGEYAGGVPWITLALVLLVLLHPRNRVLLRLPRLDWTMAGLTALAAIPWLIFALSQLELSRLNLPTDAHDQLEHWNRMAAFAILNDPVEAARVHGLPRLAADCLDSRLRFDRLRVAIAGLPRPGLSSANDLGHRRCRMGTGLSGLSGTTDTDCPTGVRRDGSTDRVRLTRCKPLCSQRFIQV